jgi:YceI-like domain
MSAISVLNIESDFSGRFNGISLSRLGCGLGLHFVRMIFAAAAFASCGTLLAQQKLLVDPASSEVHFTLVDTLHTVHGTFHIQQGEISFNPATGDASGNIVVDALSGTSGSSTRDKRMSKDELKTESYKTVTFAPTRFTGTFQASGDSALNVHGNFTILGTAHEIDVPMQVQVNGTQLHAMGTFTVPYVKWGLKDPSYMMIKVNKEVQVDLLLVGSLQH